MGLHQGCQVPFRISRGNVGFLFRCCSGKGPHLAMTGDPRGFSRVSAGFSSYNRELPEPHVWPQGCLVSIRVVMGSWGLLSIHCRANRPHLGVCPVSPCSSPVATGISGCSQDSPGESGLVSGGIKNCALLSSCDGYLLEPTEWPKGSQASCGVLREDLGLLSRHCRKRRASSHDDEGRLFFSSCGTTCGVSLELRWGTQGASHMAPGSPLSI